MTKRLMGILIFMSLLLSACAGTPNQESTGQYFDDSATTARVKTALMSASITDYSLVSVSTSDGVVQLNGYVSSDQQAELAGTTAQGVPGVNQVENNLVVKASD
ncbi:MAG: BON domain-containing protein [Gammaproteobacteria bacterium]|nr:BON domain-containing protein [Gammaproteobacteria bacterium]